MATNPQLPRSDWRSTELPRPVVPTPAPNAAPQRSLQSKPRRRLWPWIVSAFLLLIAVAGAGSYWWYQESLKPIDTTSKKERRVVIKQGETVATISEKLEAEGLIRSAFSLQLYTQLTQSKNSLQAGTYVFKPSQSVATIVDHMVKGKVDVMMVTILPGSTVQSIQKRLQETYGFSPEEVEAAFTAEYDHPLLKGKPKSASLEGYIYPETYQIAGDDTVSSLLKRSFDQMWQHIQEKKLEAGLKKHKLSLYKAITLASIIQKEVITETDMKQVAQIFYKRLADDIELGADSTFIYAAELEGVEARVSLDSPYNTRKVKGLPPGPISNTGLMALQAVANPAKGDYLYFVSGDDGTTHYSRTLAEHEAATKKYCIKNCNIFSN